MYTTSSIKDGGNKRKRRSASKRRRRRRREFSVTLEDGAGNRSRSFEASICQRLPFLYYLCAMLAGEKEEGLGHPIES